MISAQKVAKYFLSKVEEDVGDGISNLKLQKLVYYAQAYHLAMYDKPLFAEQVEAWEHGPVIPGLYREYREYGSGNIPPPDDFDPSDYDAQATELMDEVYEVFGQYSAWKLRNLTHQERPWSEAYVDGARGRVISPGSMREFYKDYVTE
jgi:uncharacterized phage-associated protein